MKKNFIPGQLLITSLQVLATVGIIFSASAVMGQTSPNQYRESRMPDEFQLAYHVAIKDYTSEAEQRANYEQQAAFEAAYLRQMQAKNKHVVVTPESPFPGPAPDRGFNIKIAQSNQKFYWASDEKIDSLNFIYDGKRSYYYDRISHRMFVYPGFRLVNGMTLALPGRSLANIPMLLHASEATPGQVDGEIYTGQVNIQGKPSYIPGRIEKNVGNPNQIDRALCYNGAKKAIEHIFSEYVNIGGVTIPKKIVGHMYNLQTEEQRDVLFLESKFQLESFSLSSPPKATFDPITLLTHEKDGNKTSKVGNRPSPEFVQWYLENGREVSFEYHPGRSLEDQAGIEDYQQNNAVNQAEHGKVDPRNYVGLGLLLFLLGGMGWKITAALKAKRKV